MKKLLHLCSLLLCISTSSEASGVIDSQKILNSYKDGGSAGFLNTASKVFAYLDDAEKDAELFKECEIAANQLSKSLKDGADTRFVIVLESLRSAQRASLANLDRKGIEDFLARSGNENLCLIDRIIATHDRALACLTSTSGFSSSVAESCSFLKAQHELRFLVKEIKLTSLSADKSLFASTSNAAVLKSRSLMVLASDDQQLVEFTNVIRQFYSTFGGSSLLPKLFVKVDQGVLVLDLSRFDALTNVTGGNWNYVNKLSLLKGVDLSSLDDIVKSYPQCLSPADSYLAGELMSVLIVKQCVGTHKASSIEVPVTKALCESGLLKQAVQYLLTKKLEGVKFAKMGWPRWFGLILSKNPSSFIWLDSEEEDMLKSIFELHTSSKKMLTLDELRFLHKSLKNYQYHEMLVGRDTAWLKEVVESVLAGQKVSELDLIINKKSAPLIHQAQLKQIRSLFKKYQTGE